MDEKPAIPIELIEQIKRARKQARLSQDDLAALASTSRRPVYLLESGRGAVRVDTLVRILDALGLELQIRPKGAVDR
ncbi:MAG: helix-turn-helix domain-containing protein [Fimbriimonas sp.]|nr:helix-turn-helix domain-containing protein [Fimbriimonas sp.]